MGQIFDRAKCQQLPLTLIGSADAQRFGNLGPEVWRWAERENYCILLSRWWHWSSRCVIQQGIALLKGPAARLGRDGPLRHGGTSLLGTSMGVGHEYPSATRDVPHLAAWDSCSAGQMPVLWQMKSSVRRCRLQVWGDLGGIDPVGTPKSVLAALTAVQSPGNICPVGLVFPKLLTFCISLFSSLFEWAECCQGWREEA